MKTPTTENEIDFEDNYPTAGHGKKPHQKIKPYIVLQYLLKYTDENHTATGKEIEYYLKEDCGIYAERRSIYRDIEEINNVAWMLENSTTIQKAEEVLAEDEEDNEKLVVYDKHKKGFYIRQRHFDLDDMRLMAECIYAAKFINQAQAKRLTDVICEFVSEPQAEQIRHDVFLTDRVKTTSKTVLNNISAINAAMSNKQEGENHTPEKISFQYLSYYLKDGKITMQERRKGALYTVSPYRLLINDGNYYLLAFDDRYKKIRTYRIDRMKSVMPTGEPRAGKEAFDTINMETYTTRVFSMFGGKDERITIRFVNSLLDSVIERFGTKEASYRVLDKTHFTVSTHIETSEKFFAWICSFGKRAKIISPPSVVEKFQSFLTDIQERYIPETKEDEK